MTTPAAPPREKAFEVRGCYWIDSGALGTLAHLVRGQMPTGKLAVAAGDTVCGQVGLQGRVYRAIPARRACARCLDRVLARAPGYVHETTAAD